MNLKVEAFVVDMIITIRRKTIRSTKVSPTLPPVTRTRLFEIIPKDKQNQEYITVNTSGLIPIGNDNRRSANRNSRSRQQRPLLPAPHMGRTTPAIIRKRAAPQLNTKREH